MTVPSPIECPLLVRQPPGQNPVNHPVAESGSCQPVSPRLSPPGRRREHPAVHSPLRGPSAPPSALFVERRTRVPRLAPRRTRRVLRARTTKPPPTSSWGLQSSNGSVPFASRFEWLKIRLPYLVTSTLVTHRLCCGHAVNQQVAPALRSARPRAAGGGSPAPPATRSRTSTTPSVRRRRWKDRARARARSTRRRETTGP